MNHARAGPVISSERYILHQVNQATGAGGALSDWKRYDAEGINEK